MIAECAADLLTRIRMVPALADNTGLTIGGKLPDPNLLKPLPPFAWVMYGGEQTDEAPYGSSSQGSEGGLIPSEEQMLSQWRVMIYVPYTDEADLLAFQHPLLELVPKTVRTSVTVDPTGGVRSPSFYPWRYTGQKLALVSSDRLAFEQHYTLKMNF